MERLLRVVRHRVLRLLEKRGAPVGRRTPAGRPHVVLSTPNVSTSTGLTTRQWVRLLAETTDENPERVAAVQLLTWAYLRTALYPGDSAWREARSALTGVARPLGRVESK